MTLVLNSSEIKKCVQLNGQLIPIIEDAFKSLALGKTTMPPILRLDIEKYHGESDVKAAYIDGLDSYAIKVASGFFNNPNLGLPSSNGLMILLDSKTGVLKSVLLDKGYLTDVRTAIAGAIASKYLSKPGSSSVAIIGAGIQAQLQLEALTLVREIKNVNVWTRDKSKAHAYIDNVSKKYDFKFSAHDNTEDLVKEIDILITTTPSKKPLIEYSSLPKGIHITAMGSDAEQKNELDPEIIQKCDVSNPLEVERAFEKIFSKWNRVDVLFNNAGISKPSKTIDEISSDDWCEVIDINLSGSFYCAKEAFKIMKNQTPQGGRIINNGSISAHVPRPGSAPYTSTKHAITGLTRSISLDGRKFNIVCSQIDIGNAGTEMTKKIINFSEKTC